MLSPFEIQWKVHKVFFSYPFCFVLDAALHSWCALFILSGQTKMYFNHFLHKRFSTFTKRHEPVRWIVIYSFPLYASELNFNSTHTHNIYYAIAILFSPSTLLLYAITLRFATQFHADSRTKRRRRTTPDFFPVTENIYEKCTRDLGWQCFAMCEPTNKNFKLKNYPEPWYTVCQTPAVSVFTTDAEK